MSLIQLDSASLNYGEQILLDQVSLTIEKGQRVCVIGRNGAGKSTLLKVLDGHTDLDGGSVWRKPNVRIARLEQDLPLPDKATVFECVAAGLEQAGQLLSEYHRLIASESVDLDQLARLQQRLEAEDGWQLHQRVESILSRLELPADAQMQELSGGWRRRVSLAKALVSDPDVLLLDEPTNHLDIASIEWLESQLMSFSGSLIFITHDRSFLQRLATHIIELDRGHIRSWEGTYDKFLEYREQSLAEEERHNALFDKKLAQEENWIRQGVKARRTRNEGRVRDLKKMRNERSERRELQGKADFSITTNEASGKLVAELKSVRFAFDTKTIIERFSTTVLRGDRIGLIGPNGAGKTTLLKLILGDLEPHEGDVKLGTNIQVAYFDQLRDQLDVNKSAVDNIAEGREYISVNGKEKHIIGYLGDFLFTGARARTPIRALSGGERNRVLLAKLFSKPANLLVLDEPTNDLDVETLELLEELLTQYDGTILLVSHDREFLNNVVTSTIAFEGMGQVNEYVGGYDDWLKKGRRWQDTNSQAASGGSSTTADASANNGDKACSPAAPQSPTPVKKKLSYKLQRELDELPGTIEKLETELDSLQSKASNPDFYQQDADAVQAHMDALSAVNERLESCFARWEELDAL